VMSICIVLAITIAGPRIGVVATTAFIIAAQFTLASMIDRFGWFGVEVVAVSWSRVLGIALLVAGAGAPLPGASRPPPPRRRRPPDGLEPALVWERFFELTEIPRPPKAEGSAREHVLAWASERGLESRVDGAGNVVVTVPAGPGREGSAPVALQSHLDMVCERDPGSPNDPRERRTHAPARTPRAPPPPP